MWGCLCVSGCKGHCPLDSFSSWDPSSSESQVFCTPSFIELSLLVFWCTYIAKHFKRSLPSWLSNLVESMFLCIHKKNYKWCSLSISFLMIIIKNWRPNCFKPFFFKYCWTNCTFKWGTKNYLLAPLFKFTSFKTVAANLCIIWSESNDILTKKWKKYKKLNHLFNFECKQKYWK